MNKQSLLVGVLVGVVAVFVIGPLFGLGWGTDRSNYEGMHKMPDNSMMSGSMMQHEMGNMMAGLSGKTGDEFDKAFLTEMIVHHEGAVEMASAALRDAKHIEIKNMANAIISAQTSEITQMKAWLKAWYSIN